MQVIKQNTQIQKQEIIPILPAISGERREVAVAARRGTKITSMLSEDDGVMVILAEIESMTEKANIISGFKKSLDMDEHEKNILNEAFVEVLEAYRWLTVEELRIIFRKGINGELGETFGFNPPALNTWIKHYSEDRKEILKDQLKYEAEVTWRKEEEIRKAKKIEEAREFCEKFITDYEALKEMGCDTPDQIPDAIDPFNTWYSLFEKKGLIRIKTEAKKKIKEKVIKEYREETGRKKDRLDTVEGRQDNERFINEVKRRCRSVVFKQKIADMIRKGEDMREILENHELIVK